MAERFRSLSPSYDVLAKRDTVSWNEQTRDVVDWRLNEVPPRRFLTEAEWEVLAHLCDRVVPQPERKGGDKVPIVPWIDAMLYADRGTGTRYAILPPWRECWRKGLAAVDAESRLRYRRPFGRLDPVEQDLLIKAMEAGEVEAPEWREVPARTFTRHVLLRQIVEIYYAHPAAWSEIGFGGPAAPRGYVRLGSGERDPWEAEEEDGTPVREARR